MIKVVKISLFTLLVALLLAFSFGAGYGVSAGLPRATLAAPSSSGSVKTEKEPKFFLINEIWNILREEFVDKDAVDGDTLTKAAIDGMLESLGDPNTSFLDARIFKLEQSSFQGSFEGIGAHVTLIEKQLVIVAPITGSPAEAAGILPGDKIISVNGESTEGMSLAEAVAKIRGPRGTKVTLTIVHQNSLTPVKVEVVRDEIQLASVFSRILPESNIAHIRISQFSQRTGSEMVSVLRDLKSKGVKGIILDVRNNPGGLVDTTVEVASQFLGDGLVLYQVDSRGNRQEWRVRRGGLALDMPLVMLVNSASASGSEVLAAALQDAGRAPLIGVKTLGKGTVNHLRPLSDGSGLYIAFALWFSPKGRSINKVGVAPDINVEMTMEDITNGRDPQLERAVEYLLSRR
ncbi:MAG: S41 family peptidase [Chloroflexi bacterium]|nr:S41 family peptidase [Chloroflexota bacterium]